MTDWVITIPYQSHPLSHIFKQHMCELYSPASAPLPILRPQSASQWPPPHPAHTNTPLWCTMTEGTVRCFQNDRQRIRGKGQREEGGGQTAEAREGRKEGGHSGGKEVHTLLTTRILSLLLVCEHRWIIGCASGSYLLLVFQISLIYRLCTFWELSTLPVQNICCFTSYILLSKFLKANIHSTYITQTNKSERLQVIAGKTQTPLFAMFVSDCRKDINPSAM